MYFIYLDLLLANGYLTYRGKPNYFSTLKKILHIENCRFTTFCGHVRIYQIDTFHDLNGTLIFYIHNYFIALYLTARLQFIKHTVQLLQTLAEINFCRGFPAPYYRALEIQGHIVAHPEIWSTRTDNETEEVRTISL